MKISAFVIFLTLFLNSCTNYEEQEKELTKLAQIYKKSNSLSKKLYLLTSIDGCGACVEHTIRYIEENINNPQSLFIVSGTSKVQLKIKFNRQIINNDNFVFDSLQLALRNKLVDSAMPRLYLCEENKIVWMKDFTYKNADSVFKYANEFLHASK